MEIMILNTIQILTTLILATGVVASIRNAIKYRRKTEITGNIFAATTLACAIFLIQKQLSLHCSCHIGELCKSQVRDSPKHQ